MSRSRRAYKSLREYPNHTLSTITAAATCTDIRRFTGTGTVQLLAAFRSDPPLGPATPKLWPSPPLEGRLPPFPERWPPPLALLSVALFVVKLLVVSSGLAVCGTTGDKLFPMSRGGAVLEELPAP